MSEEIKKMDITEFREKGYLQELNRQFLHPLGLAVEVRIDEKTGEEELGGIWDYRDDSEGMLFGEGVMVKSKMMFVEKERCKRLESRMKIDECDEDGIQRIG